MIRRRLQAVLEQRLDEVPAVVLTGPRQSGKTTLALEIAARREALYIDLESPKDRAKLTDPELYLSGHLGKLVILDEIHRSPGLFPVLRGLIDRARREGVRSGLYLLLGPASLELLRQSGETLAGRVSTLELDPFDAIEVGESPAHLDRLWLRGGFPESYLASSEPKSFRWRQDFIRAYLERDILQFAPRIAVETLRRFWVLLAHNQGGLLNIAHLSRNLGIDVKTAGSYLGLLSDLFLVRRLAPWHGSIQKRLVKSPKTYVRDTGIVHALLGLAGKEELLAHPVAGPSWEGLVIESLLTLSPSGVEGFFYRSSGGAEIDLLLGLPGGRLWAVEIKRSLAPRPAKGFHSACEDLRPERRFVVYPGEDRYPLGSGAEAISLPDLARLLQTAIS